MKTVMNKIPFEKATIAYKEIVFYPQQSGAPISSDQAFIELQKNQIQRTSKKLKVSFLPLQR